MNKSLPSRPPHIRSFKKSQLWMTRIEAPCRSHAKRRHLKRQALVRKHSKIDKRELKGLVPKRFADLQNCLPSSSSFMRLLFEFNKVLAVVDANRRKFAHQICAHKAVKAHFFLWNEEADAWRNFIIAAQSELAFHALR